MRLIVFLSIFFCFFQSQAQFYTVKGKVTGISIEPLPFITVNVKDQVNTTVTNEAGEFNVKLVNGKYTFVFTGMGYETYKQDVIVNNEDVILNVILKEAVLSLNEIEVAAKYTDPARGIVMQVIKSKSKYVQTAYQSDLYIKAVESENKFKSKKDSLNKADSHHDLQKEDSLKVAKKHKLLSKDDSLKAKAKLPMIYDRFNIAEIAIRKSFEYPNKLKEERIGYEAKGDVSGLFYLSTTEGEFNFYQNAVYCPSLSEMPILSPLSSSGLLMYKYKTLKVYEEDGKRIYRIKVEPNIFANSLVSGEMEIVDTLFCLRNFKFSFPKHQVTEYTSFVLQSEFVPYDDTLYRINKMTFDYKIGGKKKGSHGKTSVFFENYKYEKGFAKKYFNNEVSSTLEEAYKKDTAFWQQIRKEPLTDKELKFIRIEDSIKVAHQSKTYLDSIDRLENRITVLKIALFGQSHYKRKTEFRMNFDPLWTCYQPIGVGGQRIRYGFWSRKEFESKKMVFVSANLSYGIINNDINGQVSINNLYNTFKRSYWGIGIGRSFDIVNASDTWTAVFRTANYYLNDYINVYHSTELFNGFYWHIGVDYSIRKSTTNYENNTLTNLIFDNGETSPLAFQSYNAFYLNNSISYTPEQKYIREPHEKIVLGSRYPTLRASYRKGIPNLFNSSINFDYLEFSLTQDIDFRFWGIAKIRFSTGKFYNAGMVKEIDYKYQPRVGAPFYGNPLSSFQSLEQSYITLDRFYAGHYFHRFNGALINKIPGMKYLKISELAGGGFLRSKENDLIYFEAYAGLEKNIRIFKEMFRLGIFFVEGKTNNYSYTTGFRIAIEQYDRANNKWKY